MPQPVRPKPGRIGLVEDKPRADIVEPQLVAVGVPIIPHQLDRPFRSIELEPGSTVALDRETCAGNGEYRLAEVEQDVHVVLDLDGDVLAADEPIRYGRAGHGGYAPYRAEPAGEAGDVVDCQVEDCPAAGAVEPTLP